MLAAREDLIYYSAALAPTVALYEIPGLRFVLIQPVRSIKMQS
jgi:hypothetical protein